MRFSVRFVAAISQGCKPDAIFSAICRRDIAGVSNMFETCCNFSATKIASSCRDKNRLCKRTFKSTLIKGLKNSTVNNRLSNQSRDSEPSRLAGDEVLSLFQDV